MGSVNYEWSGEYLVSRNSTSRRAHLWTGFDTVCRMYGTKGLRKKKYVVQPDANEQAVCSMCEIVSRRGPGVARR